MFVSTFNADRFLNFLFFFHTQLQQQSKTSQKYDLWQNSDPQLLLYLPSQHL